MCLYLVIKTSSAVDFISTTELQLQLNNPNINRSFYTPKIITLLLLLLLPNYKSLPNCNFSKPLISIRWIENLNNNLQFFGQAVQGKLFGSKEIVALSCAWCHEVLHNKETCFNQSKISEACSLGKHFFNFSNFYWFIFLFTATLPLCYSATLSYLVIVNTLIYTKHFQFKLFSSTFSAVPSNTLAS